MKDELVGILEACIQGCDTGIPHYAYGDNQAACEMAHRLSQIAEDLNNALEMVNPNSAEIFKEISGVDVTTTPEEM